MKRLLARLHMREGMTWMAALLLGLTMTVSFMGCETTQGAGEDIQETSQEVEEELDL